MHWASSTSISPEAEAATSSALFQRIRATHVTRPPLIVFMGSEERIVPVYANVDKSMEFILSAGFMECGDKAKR